MPSQFKFTTAAPHIGNDKKQFIAAGTDYLMICDLLGGQQCKAGPWLWSLMSNGCGDVSMGLSLWNHVGAA
jgi:hypothetical protein